MASHVLSKDGNRWGFGRRDRRDAMASGEHRPAERALVVNCDRRTEEQRRADNAALAAQLRVSARCFI